MHAVVRIIPIVVVLLPSLCSNAQEVTQITLDSATREKCQHVLRTGLRSEVFWPSMHAAEGLTLGGHGLEVIDYLTPKLKTETDDQYLCGLAREIVRAGDRSVVPVMLNILEGDNYYGHVHAAESLFKVFEMGVARSGQRWPASGRHDNSKAPRSQ